MNANKLVFLMALVVMTIAPMAASSASDRAAQIMRERNVAPSVLADRIERQCARRGQIDPDCKPDGSNATVGQIRDSINANPEGRELVPTVADLPHFLRGLRKGPFNEAQCLAGMNGEDLAAYCRNLRAPHEGEAGWWHGDLFVLAGDCLNARVGFYVPTLETVEAKGTRWQPYAARQWTEPFAERTGDRCPIEGMRLTGVHVFAQDALRTPCAQQYVIDQNRFTSGRGTVGSWVRTGSEDVFSLQCGREMHEMADAGTIGWSRQAHAVELILVQDGQVTPIFKGTVTGNVLTPADENSALLLTPDGKFVDVPPELTTGMIVWTFPNGGMETPTASGAGMDITRLQRSEGCRARVKVASAIEGGTGRYAYGD